jgi:hypothetical protein
VSKESQVPEDEPKQKTLKGKEIPLPTRRRVMDAFRKIVEPAKPKKEKD